MTKIETIKLTDGKQVITVNKSDAKDPRFKGFKPLAKETKSAKESALKEGDDNGETKE